MAYRLISFSVRAGLAGGFIYYTREEGLWGDAKQATKLYEKIYANTADLMRDVPIQVPDIPKPHEMCAFTRVNWNKAVYATFDGIVAAPSKICEWSCKGWDAMTKLINEPPAPALPVAKE